MEFWRGSPARGLCRREFVLKSPSTTAGREEGGFCRRKKRTLRRICPADGTQPDCAALQVRNLQTGQRMEMRTKADRGRPVADRGSLSRFAFPLFSGLKRENRRKLTKSTHRSASVCYWENREPRMSQISRIKEFCRAENEEPRMDTDFHEWEVVSARK
jgi:hypothetical protein